MKCLRAALSRRLVSAFFSCALAAQAASSISAAGTGALPSDADAPAASAIFGGGLALPGGLSLQPRVATRLWAIHAATGGLEPDADGWRAFRLRTAGPGSPVLRGKARFCEGADGSIRAEWRVTPSADADLAETFIDGHFSAGAMRGGCALVDDGRIPLPLDGAVRHPFRGAVSRLSLRDNSGDEIFRVRFERPTRVLLQDGAAWGGSDLTVRFFFAEGAVKGGEEYAIDASVSLPQAGSLSLGAGTGLVLEVGPQWTPIQYDPWIEPGSALDFTDVVPRHAPAGKFGRVIAVGDHFEFEDLPGVPQRFYGVNLCETANLPSSSEAADRFVANLVRTGYNAVRIHHHEKFLFSDDGKPIGAAISRPVGAGLQSAPCDGTAPAPEQMLKLDWLVAACVERGVYLTTDLFVSRQDAVPWRAVGVDRDGSPGSADYKILCAFHEGVFSNLCAWTRNFLGHVNPFTGRSLAEEPALATLATVNEGNLGNWGAAKLGEYPSVRAAWEDWLARKAAEEPAAFTGIPATVPRSLEGGGDTPAGRHAAAFAIFLAEREARLHERLARFVRDECGCMAPLSALSSWYQPVQYQLPRTLFDYVDDHHYVDHPDFLFGDWHLPATIANQNPLKGAAAGAMPVEWRRLMDKPFCLTEWNWAGPGRYRGLGGLVTGALGALQGWSGMWRFAWSHNRRGIESPGGRIGFFETEGDPCAIASERAALCLFLRRDLPELEARYPLVLSESELRDPAGGTTRCEIVPALVAGWHAKVGSTVVPEGARPQAAPAVRATLDTTAEKLRRDLAALGAGEPGGGVRIDTAAGSIAIDAPRFSGGFAERGRIDAGALAFDVGSVPTTVFAVSLDGAPLDESRRILVTHLTDVQNDGIRYGDPQRTILLDWGLLPHIMRAGKAEVELRIGNVHKSSLINNGTNANDNADRGLADNPFRVFALSSSGRRLREVPCEWTAAGSCGDDASSSQDVPHDASSSQDVQHGDGGVVATPRSVLRFSADVAADPASATWLYEIEARPLTDSAVPPCRRDTTTVRIRRRRIASSGFSPAGTTEDSRRFALRKSAN